MKSRVLCYNEGEIIAQAMRQTSLSMAEFVTGLKENKPDMAKPNIRVSRKQNSQYKHGHRTSAYTSPTWISWRAMVERCTNPNASDYHNYGGRGIKVCDRWKGSFESFLEDMGERPKGKTLDRKEVNGNYTPENCKWSTTKEQSRNRRTTVLITLDNRTQTLGEWAKETGISRHTIQWRLKNGWSVERALNDSPMPREERGILGLISRGVYHAH